MKIKLIFQVKYFYDKIRPRLAHNGENLIHLKLRNGPKALDLNWES